MPFPVPVIAASGTPTQTSHDSGVSLGGIVQLVSGGPLVEWDWTCTASPLNLQEFGEQNGMFVGGVSRQASPVFFVIKSGQFTFRVRARNSEHWSNTLTLVVTGTGATYASSGSTLMNDQVKAEAVSTAIAAAEAQAAAPSADQKNALAGSHGTPSATNLYVTASDPAILAAAAALNADLVSKLALLDPSVNPCVTVSGAAAGADGRGGVFVNVLEAGGPAVDNKMVFASATPLWRWVRATQQIEITGSLDLKAYLACDGTTNDQPAMQTVLDNALGDTSATRPARFRLVKSSALGDTLVFNKQSVEIHGGGWSVKDRYTEGGFVGLAGVAGKPLLHFKSCYASRVRDIHLSALAASPASAGIYLEQTVGVGAYVNWCNVFKNIYIGSMEIGTDVPETQFETGVLFGGADANNETNRFENLIINRPWVGVWLTALQYFGNMFDGLRVHYASKCAVRTWAMFVARECMFLGCGGCADITAADGVTSVAATRTLTSASRDFEALGVRQDDKLTIAAGPDTCTAWVVSASGHTLTIDADWPTGGTAGVSFVVSGGVGDLDLIQSGATIKGFHDEYGYRLARFRSPNGPIQLDVEDGNFLLCTPGTGGAGLAPDGIVIDARDAPAASIAWDVYLKRVAFPVIGGYAGPTATITMKEKAGGAGGGRLTLDDCPGILAANIDMNPTYGPGNTRQVRIFGEGVNAQQQLVDGTVLDPTLGTFEVPDILRAKRARFVPSAIVGPPTSGAHVKGEVSVDVSGDVWICDTSGTVGSWHLAARGHTLPLTAAEALDAMRYPTGWTGANIKGIFSLDQATDQLPAIPKTPTLIITEATPQQPMSGIPFQGGTVIHGAVAFADNTSAKLVANGDGGFADANGNVVSFLTCLEIPTSSPAGFYMLTKAHQGTADGWEFYLSAGVLHLVIHDGAGGYHDATLAGPPDALPHWYAGKIDDVAKSATLYSDFGTSTTVTWANPITAGAQTLAMGKWVGPCAGFSSPYLLIADKAINAAILSDWMGV